MPTRAMNFSVVIVTSMRCWGSFTLAQFLDDGEAHAFIERNASRYDGKLLVMSTDGAS